VIACRRNGPDALRAAGGSGLASLPARGGAPRDSAPVVDGAFNFANPEDRAKLAPMRASVTPEGTDRDAVAYLAFLDAMEDGRARWLMAENDIPSITDRIHRGQSLVRAYASEPH
jgi:hypothetical protein